MADEVEEVEEVISFQSSDSDEEYGAWVYCNQHLMAHTTGWCTVHNRNKVGLGSFQGTFAEQAKQACDKCVSFGLDLFRGY